MHDTWNFNIEILATQSFSTFQHFGTERRLPRTQPNLHVHGHVEINVIENAEMTYQFGNSSTELVVKPNHAYVFWAAIPHKAVKLTPVNDQEPILTNFYIPLDRFLHLGNISAFQLAVLRGAFLELPETPIPYETMLNWYRDASSLDPTRIECMDCELSSILWRHSLIGHIKDMTTNELLDTSPKQTDLNEANHIPNMIKFVLSNLNKPFSISEAASSSGLNSNYGSNLFKKQVGISLKRFVLSMRLCAAHRLLLTTSLPALSIMYDVGFNSVSQFYYHFKNEFGVTPNELRG